jgi:hypothetical protein
MGADYFLLYLKLVPFFPALHSCASSLSDSD